MMQKTTIARLTLLLLLLMTGVSKAQEAKPQQASSEAAAPKEEFKPSVRYGAFIQAQAQVAQEATSAVQDDAGYTQHWGHQLQLRRARITADGALTKELSFFAETDITGRLGNVSATGAKTSQVPSQQVNVGTTKTNAVSVALLDAFATYKFSNELSVIGGLQNVAVWRYGGLQSGAKLMLIDAPSTSAAPFDGAFTTFGARDIGVTLRGFVLDEKLEYRAGVYEGQSFANNYSPVRTTVRLNYNFFDVEKGYLYQGTALGKGKYLSVGGGVDNQAGYFGYAVDFFFDQPVLDGASLTVSGAFGRYHGTGNMLTFFPTQQMVFAEAGLLLKDYNLQPVVKFEWNKLDANATYWTAKNGAVVGTDGLVKYYNDQGSNMIIGAGLNYWLTGNYSSSLKLLWEGTIRNRPTLNSTTADPKTEKQFINTVTLQWTWFII